MPAWFVYMVRCADGSLYTGISTDVAARIAAHNRGRGARYTRSRLPVALLMQERKRDKSAALRRELAIKALPRAMKLVLVETAARKTEVKVTKTTKRRSARVEVGTASS